ncbi:MAG: hypothetical protein HEQ23_09860 [Tepidisphaera sp.]
MTDTPTPLSPSELTISHARRKLARVPAFQFAPTASGSTSTLIGTLDTRDGRVEIHTDRLATLWSPEVTILYTDIESIHGPDSKDPSADATLTLQAARSDPLTLAFPCRDRLNDAFIVLTFLRRAAWAWKRGPDEEADPIVD